MNHGAKAGGWQRAGRAALTLLILAGIVFVAYHDWVMAVAAPNTSQSPITRATSP